MYQDEDFSVPDVAGRVLEKLLGVILSDEVVTALLPGQRAALRASQSEPKGPYCFLLRFKGCRGTGFSSTQASDSGVNSFR